MSSNVQRQRRCRSRTQQRAKDGADCAERKDLQIIARAKDARHAAHLYRMGVSHAVPETIEASRQLSEAVLVDVGVAMGPVIASIHEKRSQFQAQIQKEVPEGVDIKIGRRRLRDVESSATD